MHVMKVRNVCEALSLGVQHVQAYGRLERSRGGDVQVLPGPMFTETLRPQERVLFSAVRDANPFFHLCEATWMLAGQRDARPLDVFVSNFSERFTEQDGDMHGAYGHRWRHHFKFDQLNQIVTMLVADPTTRQAVLTMWDPNEHTTEFVCNDDMMRSELIGGADLTGVWRDRPCNTHAYFRVRYEQVPNDHAEDWTRFLDMTVCCRSNDLIWGAHGANAVHFSVLQEYVAARVGCQVGTMWQLSNNYHAYVSFLSVLEKRTSGGFALSVHLADDRYDEREVPRHKPRVAPQPMFTAPDHIDVDVRKFWRWFLSQGKNAPSYSNLWFASTLEPMMLAHWHYKRGDHAKALEFAREVDAEDWSTAAVEWLQRRSRDGEKRSDDVVQSAGSESQAVPHVADADRPVGR